MMMRCEGFVRWRTRRSLLTSPASLDWGRLAGVFTRIPRWGFELQKLRFAFFTAKKRKAFRRRSSGWRSPPMIGENFDVGAFPKPACRGAALFDSDSRPPGRLTGG